jgi:hypothetical protein
MSHLDIERYKDQDQKGDSLSETIRVPYSRPFALKKNPLVAKQGVLIIVTLRTDITPYETL